MNFMDHGKSFIIAFAVVLVLLGGVAVAQTTSYWTFDAGNEGFTIQMIDETHMVNWYPMVDRPSPWSPTGGIEDGHIYTGTTTGWDGRLYSFDHSNDHLSLGALSGKTLQAHFRRDNGTFVSPSGYTPLVYWYISESVGYPDCNTWVSKVGNSIDVNAMPQDQWQVYSIEVIPDNFMKWANCPDGTMTFTETVNDYNYIGVTFLSDQVTESMSDPWDKWQKIDGVYRLPHYGVTTTTNAIFRIDNFGPVEAMDDDFGDLPAAYNTTHANNGARHQIGALRLGSAVESEPDGHPSSAADGDGSEEDGVTRQTGAAGGAGWREGTVASGHGGGMEITISGGSGVPQVFMDFDGSHALTEVTLRDAAGAPLAMPLATGAHRVYFDIPAGAFSGADNAIAARVRLSSAGGLAATGAALDGEVEDYIWHFGPNAVTLTSLRANPASRSNRIPGVLFLLAGSALLFVMSARANVRTRSIRPED